LAAVSSGLAVARELRRRDAGARIVVLEKEPRVGVHPSAEYVVDEIARRRTGA
jgi:flavin-dependent dehydrogenase